MIPPIREPKGFEAIPLPVPSSTDTSVFAAGDFRAYALTPGQRGIDGKPRFNSSTSLMLSGLRTRLVSGALVAGPGGAKIILFC